MVARLRLILLALYLWLRILWHRAWLAYLRGRARSR